MGKKTIGLDIGSDSVKMALVHNGTVRNLAAAELPEGLISQGGIKNVQALAKFLRELARKNGLHAKQCALALPVHQAFTLCLNMAEMTEKQLLLNLPYEFRDYINEEPEQYFYDYALISRSVNDLGESRLELLAACARKDTVHAYADLCRRAGWTLTTVVSTQVAYWNLLNSYRGKHQEPSEFCLVDLGHSGTRLFIYSGRSLEAERITEVSSGDSADTRAQSALEISRALNFYAYSNRGNQLQSVWLCGGGALDGEAVAAVREVLSLQVRDASGSVQVLDVSELMPHAEQNRELAALCPAAVGAAL